MAETTVNLGMLPKNRGEYSSSATYYKDNIVQYNGSSYICTAAMDLEHPSGISGVAPYDSDPAVPNTGWAVFCNGSSGVGEGVYDVSVDHTTDNQPKKYVDLSAALKDVPQAKQKGGMTIRFIQSSDNKYVQARCMLSGSFTAVQFANAANWQGVDDEVIPGSQNLVEGRGVAAQDFALGAHFTKSGDAVNPFVRFKYLGYKAGDIIRCKLLSNEAETPAILVYEIYNDITYSELGRLTNIGLEKSFQITRDDVIEVMFRSIDQEVPFSVEIYKYNAQIVQDGVNIEDNTNNIASTINETFGNTYIKTSKPTDYDGKQRLSFKCVNSKIGDIYKVRVVEDGASSPNFTVFEIFDATHFRTIGTITSINTDLECTITQDGSKIQINSNTGYVFKAQLVKENNITERVAALENFSTAEIKPIILGTTFVSYNSSIYTRCRYSNYKAGGKWFFKLLTWDNENIIPLFDIYEIYADNTYSLKKHNVSLQVGEEYEFVLSSRNDITTVQFNNVSGTTVENSIQAYLKDSISYEMERIESEVDDVAKDFNDTFNIYGGKKVDFEPSDELLRKLRSELDLEITPVYYGDVYMIPCYGQSLSINTQAGPSTFNYTEPLSYNVNLQNANIQDMCAGTAEAFRIMADKYGISLPSNFKVIGCTGGTGGASVLQLSKGTTYYNNVINYIKTAKTACDAQGLKLNVPCFTWTQGEEDMRCGGNKANYGYGNWNPFEYKDKLRQLIDDFNKDIKAITHQENDVLCISYQVASHTSYGRYPRIALQQAELAKEDSRMILAKPMYDVDYVRETSSSDPGTTDLDGFEVHAYARSYRNMGNHYGIAAFVETVIQRHFKWVHPIMYSLQDNILDITFEVPVKPLVLDTTLVDNLPDGNYGFNIYNVDEGLGETGSITEATTRITSVSIVDENTVRIVMSRNPVSGERFTYGINGDYWQNVNGGKTILVGEVNDGYTKSGHLHGSRGCLRDSQNIVNTNSGAALPYLYNWSVIFEHVF